MILGTQIPDISFVVTLIFVLQMGLKKPKSRGKLKMFSAIRAVSNKQMGLTQA
jgi:hypothetical protein